MTENDLYDFFTGEWMKAPSDDPIAVAARLAARLLAEQEQRNADLIATTNAAITRAETAEKRATSTTDREQIRSCHDILNGAGLGTPDSSLYGRIFTLIEEVKDARDAAEQDPTWELYDARREIGNLRISLRAAIRGARQLAIAADFLNGSDDA